MDNEASSSRIIKSRRRYSREFKERVLAECLQPGESLAAVAVRHGLNPNMVHKWRKSLQRRAQGEFVRLPAPGTDAPGLASEAEPPAARRVTHQRDTIRMEVPTPQGHLVVHWPVSQLPLSIAWLRALTR
jgi:transposase